jgi:dipeptidyl aminopeptidase/acylaminoacyl peptidase
MRGTREPLTLNNASEKPYGLWDSYLEIDQAVDRSTTPSYPFSTQGELFWLEALSLQKGRNAIIRQSGLQDRDIVTPLPFNIRTRVNEYGGKCFAVSGSKLVFNNFEDNSLYLQDVLNHNEPRLLFDGDNIKGCCGFADIGLIPELGILVAVSEQEVNGSENQSCLIAIPLDLSDAGHPEKTYFVLARGADFYASPVVCSSRPTIAWVEWDHPFMPWDQTRLLIADLEILEDGLNIYNVQRVVDQDDVTVFQPGFLSDGRLLYISDGPKCNYWNFYVYSKEIDKQTDNAVRGPLTVQINGNKHRQVTDHQVEYGEAHWVFGQSRWVDGDKDRVIAIASGLSGDNIVEINISTGEASEILETAARYGDLNFTDGGQLLVVAHYADRDPEIIRAFGNVSKNTTGNDLENGNKARQNSNYSAPRLLKFNSDFNNSSGSEYINHAYAYFYPPFNPAIRPDQYDDQTPPLIVTIHGGPTGRTDARYNALRQYFCSLGFALLDVNHRGSSGYGRAFRQSLLGQWGVLDVEDIASAINYVVSREYADPNRVFIRGSSAGGYAVLRALTTYPELFCGGACYYGIGNLITLSEITHKFESHYTDRLIGETFDGAKSRKPESNYVKRSPVFELDQITSPLIVFQGSEDKVVPPKLACEIVDGLKQKGIRYSYTEYPGEGHGFRVPENRKDALQKEIEFYQAIIQQVPPVIT